MPSSSWRQASGSGRSSARRRWSVRGLEHGVAYQVEFTPRLPVFRLERKLARLKIGPAHRHRAIVDVRPVPSYPVRCIQVAARDGMFLVGKTYIPTHNSSLGRLGLLTHSTAGFIDPGFTGHITLELSNVANLPITLWPGMKIGQLCLFRLSTPAERPYGSDGVGSRYQGQRGPTASRAHLNFHRVGHAAPLTPVATRERPVVSPDDGRAPDPALGKRAAAGRASARRGRTPVHPAARTAGPAPTPPPGGSRSAGPHQWRRLTRTQRGAAGLAIVVAALLLWPFAGWFWIPWLAGVVVLVLVALLRLDRLLQGWSWHLAGLAVVVGLMLKTEPWDWALAASLGVLLAGLVQLPWWRLAAVGAVLCVVSGVGWGVQQYRAAQERAAQEAQASLQNRGQLGVARPNLALQVLLSSVGRGDVGPVCDSLLAEPARPPFAAAAGAADCAGAVRSLAARVDDAAMYARGRAPSARPRRGVTVDACHISVADGATPGPQLGILTVGRDGARTSNT